MENTNQTQEVSVKTKAIAKWAIAVSTISLLFTAYATIRPFDKENFSVEGAKELRISEHWGQLYFYHYFVIKNDGEKQGAITSIDALIVPLEGQKYEKYLSAQSYGIGSDSYPIVNISFNPNNICESYFVLSDELGRERREGVTKWSIRRNNEIEAIEKESDWDYRPKELGYSVYSSLQNFIQEGFKDFTIGKYQYIIAFTKNYESKPFYFKCYDFVIHQTDLQILNNGIKNYGIGGFLTTLNLTPHDCQTTVKLTLNEDKELRGSLLNKLLACKSKPK
ncbi:MAG: hypothetical protein FWH23_04720 [Bacteroidales bacterium]|nr:hypothetical protein [Bacteroidales bacterium]MCL2133447.1 hypothetical protein [Bacteroidales bacterium]